MFWLNVERWKGHAMHHESIIFALVGGFIIGVTVCTLVYALGGLFNVLF